MTRKVILEDKDGEELVPYTELATSQQPGRVRPDGSSLVVNSNGVISVNGATGTEIGYLSGVTSGLQGQLDNTVHKTGNETIGGNKTFSGLGTFRNYNAFWKTPYNIIVRSESIEDGVTPSSNQFMGIEFRDKNDVRVGWIGLAKKTDGTQLIELQKQGSTSGFTAPTPSVGDNSNQIATTAYVTNKVSTKADKASFQVVSALPANPDSNTFYFIPE